MEVRIETEQAPSILRSRSQKTPTQVGLFCKRDLAICINIDEPEKELGIKREKHTPVEWQRRVGSLNY